MRALQDAVAGFPDVRLVSFTVDPERDTPRGAGRAMRSRYQADPERWFFLTGDAGAAGRAWATTPSSCSTWTAA